MSEGDHIDLGIDGITEAVPIGSGGAAMVYRARQPQLSRTVAVKVIQAVGDEASARRFGREARALGQLSEHPGIVTVHDMGRTSSGQPFLIMQFCEAGSLQDRLGRDGPLPGDETIVIATSIADALRHAHGQGIMHRDLKPANVLVGNDGRYLVADFGIAALADTSAIVSTAVSFTPGYAPPETIQGEPASPASDVYSLGATIYALVTGTHPFAEDGEANIYTLIHRILNDELDDTRRLGVSDELAQVIEDCTDKDPEQRPTMEQLLEQLGAIEPVAEVPTAPPTYVTPRTGTVSSPPQEPSPGAPPPSPPPADAGTGRRRWWVVAAGILVVVVIVAVVALARAGDDPIVVDPPTTTTAARPTTSQTAATVAPTSPGPFAPAVVATADVGGAPQDPLPVDDSLWVANRDDGTVSVVAADGSVDSIDVGLGPLRVVAGVELLWVANDADDSVTAIDPATREVVTTLDVGGRPRPPELVEDDLWVPTVDGIAVIDERRLEVVATIDGVGERPQSPLVTEDSVWVPDVDTSSVAVVDPASRAVLETVSVGSAPLQPVAIGDQVWVASEQDATVTVIDRESRRVVATIDTGPRPTHPVELDGSVWLASRSEGSLLRIDPDSYAVVDEVGVGADASGVTVHDGRLWVSNPGAGQVRVVDAGAMAIVATIGVGDDPARPTSAGAQVAVANRAGASVSIIR